MKKNVLLSFLLALLTVSVWAQKISEQQARERVLQFLSDNTSAMSRGLHTRGVQMEAAKVEAKSIYAFNIEGGGYVIASGDKRALPVLGYSDTGTIDWDRMPDNMRAWLKQYDEAIKTLGKNKTFRDGNSIFAKGKTRTAWAAIKPLIKTTWYQDAPYWDKCPLYDGADESLVGQHCLTGCVATAMAQVMNFWQWPKSSPEIPAYDQATAHEGKEKIWTHPALPAVTFDWDNMIENYQMKNPETGMTEVVGTDVEKEAVATLMQYCGQSIYSSYSPGFTSSMGQFVAEALAKYFCYDGDVRNVSRVKYTIDEWEALLYGELTEGRPVPYGGMSDDSGHQFVCDGYDGAGLYHINWGWGGSDDGYFSLSVLNPYNNSSAGSTSSSLGYCMEQDMVVGVKPAPEGTAPTIIPAGVHLYEASPFDINAGKDSVMVSLAVDTYERQVAFDYGLGTRGDDGTLTPIFTDKFDQQVDYTSYYFQTMKIDRTNAIFADGQTVKLYPMVKLQDGEWELAGTIYNYIYATPGEDGLEFAIDMPNITITDAKFTYGTGREGTQNEFTLTVTNNDSIDFRHQLSLCAGYYGKIDSSEVDEDTPVSWGDWFSSVAYIRPGETADVPFNFKPMDTGLLAIFLFSKDGGYLGDLYYVMNDTIGCYDAFVRNDSHLDVDYVYTRDYQQASYNKGDELRPGHYTWHVSFADNNATGHPYGRPSDKIFCYGAIRDIARDQVSERKFTDEAVDYLTKLPTNGGNGDWKFEFDVSLDIRLGGIYTTRAYFCEDLDETGNNGLFSAWTGGDLTIYDDPGIHVVGDTILASGTNLNLELELNTGYPYDPGQFTGNEQARATLYSVEDDGTLAEQSVAKWKLDFDDRNPDKALVSTQTLTDNIADGHYILRIESDWTALGTRDVNLLVGTTGINDVSKSPTAVKGPYTDLQGRRHVVPPTRKGIYIRNNRKVLVKSSGCNM